MVFQLIKIIIWIWQVTEMQFQALDKRQALERACKNYYIHPFL